MKKQYMIKEPQIIIASSLTHYLIPPSLFLSPLSPCPSLSLFPLPSPCPSAVWRAPVLPSPSQTEAAADPCQLVPLHSPERGVQRQALHPLQGQEVGRQVQEQHLGGPH